MSELSRGFVEVAPNVFICLADADTRAVMGAKTSRAPDLAKRWDELMASNGGEAWPWGAPPEMVKSFLDTNLKGYMHASIAEMAEVFVHAKGLGWPATWLVEDNPLFVGQEVSTRAVDVTKEDRERCDYSDPRLENIHHQWIAVFEALRDQVTQKGGYKFDDIRWALPGTTRLGVTMCNKVRDGVRQLEQIQGLGGSWAAMAQKLLKGFEAYAPRATDAVMRGARRPSSLWRVETTAPDPHRTNRPVTVFYRGSVLSSRPRVAPREKPNTYLDPAWHFYGPFEFTVRCSVAAARDWHRHRAVMPWRMAVCVDKTKTPLLRVHELADLSVDMRLPKLWEETSKAFFELKAGDDPLQALYALPFGAEVELTCEATLPSLLYMLELRYSAQGAHEEYKKQARAGLFHLASVLGPTITREEQILGCLSPEDREMWEHIKDYL